MLFRRPGHAPVIATLGSQHRDPPRPLEVALPGPATLAGTLTLVGNDAMRAVTGCIVVLRARLGDVVAPPWSLDFGGFVESRSAVDAEGRFRLDEVAPGIRLDAEVRLGDEVLWSPDERLLLVEGATESVAWEVGHSAVVRAHFLELDAGPVRDLEVYLDVPPQEGVRYQRSLSPRVRRAQRSRARLGLAQSPDG